MINFEETELRLGLPGGGGLIRKDIEESNLKSTNGKRGFSETESVDLKLNLSTASTTTSGGAAEQGEKMKEKVVAVPSPNAEHADPPPPAKAQVVGWPPVRSFRKNVMAVQKPNANEESAEKEAAGGSTASSVAFVKVSMDGAPYLRKVDLKMYKTYHELSDALAKMFCSFTIGNCGSQGTKDFTSESKLADLLNGSEYVPTYEDKDGDWMLVGDVPWEMFVGSCKRMRIMKGSEAIGLGQYLKPPRAVEKCMSRS